MKDLAGLPLAEQNDIIRQNFGGGDADQSRTVVTQGIQSMFGSFEDSNELIMLVRNFSDFNESNDPHGERDFFAFDFQGKTAYFKMDYFADSTMESGSSEPQDPSQTYRAMTVMLASEY